MAENRERIQVNFKDDVLREWELIKEMIKAKKEKIGQLPYKAIAISCVLVMWVFLSADLGGVFLTYALASSAIISCVLFLKEHENRFKQ